MSLHRIVNKNIFVVLNRYWHYYYYVKIRPEGDLIVIDEILGTCSILEKTTDNIIKAARTGDLRLLRELHSQGYSLLSIDSAGQTALHHAAKHGHKDIIKYLIACAPTTIVNMVDNDKGRTALHVAAANKHRNICCTLVAGGASLTKKDHTGKTPRQLALQAEDPELAAYLESQEQFQLVSEDLETVV